MSFWKYMKQRFSKTKEQAQSTPGDKNPLGLTARELDVFRLLLEGYTIQETADMLGVKYSTVNTHMTAIYRKLSVTSRAELIIRYRNFESEANSCGIV